MSYAARHRSRPSSRSGARGAVVVATGAALVLGGGALVQSRVSEAASAATARPAAVRVDAPVQVASSQAAITPGVADAVLLTGGGDTAAVAATSRAAVTASAVARSRMLRADIAAGRAGAPKQIARVLLAQRGWGASEFACLDHLWTKESDWTPTADNPGSDAYGIPQSLPGEKMASEGADWRTNPATQIRWGLKYIAEVYDTPCGAWAHSRATNWY